MPMTEDQYDELFAPRLRDIAKEAAELGSHTVIGIDFISRTTGQTEVAETSGLSKHASLSMKASTLALRMGGSIDKFLLSLLKHYPDACKDSVFLRKFIGPGEDDL